jgi:hypothetical protein
MPRISNAFDAYRFLHDHPAFRLSERSEITLNEAVFQREMGFLITKDRGGQHYRVWRHVHRRAIAENLDIFYTKTDKPGGHGTVQEDKSKNRHVECWLEFGPLSYGYSVDWEDTTRLQHEHDWRLDTGGSTFDEAIVSLARLVKKFYGDYKLGKRTDDCDTPICADCLETGFMVERLGLGKKK